MAESRRTFLKQSAATVAAASLASCVPSENERPDTLVPATLRAVGEAVLPGSWEKTDARGLCPPSSSGPRGWSR